MSVDQREFDEEPVTPELDDQPAGERIVGVVRGARCGAVFCRDRGYRPYATHRPTHASPPGSGGITSRKIFWHNRIGEIGRHRP
ncbi:hypothetical protein C5E45_13195 [Nocardia nova]|uniref:Uncharacterized protein n=1 Tax=Nocardia nova TaxID=37330 RepID=A0A2S6AQV9_9NOCA|nr:hypothetical protein C5E41_28235 [Nocardia nova]PPJ37622.1 hypothetical protein C5E45_13195 [Nocardia nova]